MSDKKFLIEMIIERGEGSHIEVLIRMMERLSEPDRLIKVLLRFYKRIECQKMSEYKERNLIELIEGRVSLEKPKDLFFDVLVQVDILEKKLQDLYRENIKIPL